MSETVETHTPHILKVSFKGKKTKNPDGTETVIPAREPVIVTLPVPTFDEILTQCTKPIIRDYIVRLVQADIADTMENVIRTTEGDTFTQANVNLDLITLENLALVPEAERRGGGIAKETWAAFGESYVQVMTREFAKEITVTQATNAAKVLTARLAPVKSNKPAISRLMHRLNSYYAAAGAEAQESFAEIYSFLTKKAEELLAVSEDAAADAF